MKMELRRPKSALVFAFYDLQLLKMQVIDFWFKATFFNPKWSQTGFGNSILEGSIFEGNFELNFLNSGLPRQPPEAGAGGRRRADLR